MQQPLRVHIIPAGDDLAERIALPALNPRADRIYLIRFEGNDLFAHIAAKAKQVWAEHGIGFGDIREVSCNFYDFAAVMRTFAKITGTEKAAGNHVFVNVSTGGKLNSVAGMLACSLFGGTPYFCKEVLEPGMAPSILNPPEVLTLPRYAIDQVPEDLVRFLARFLERVKNRQPPKLSKGEGLEIVVELHHDAKLTHKTSGDYNKLKFQYLDKLAARQFLKVEAGPRGKMLVTAEGAFAADIFTAYYGALKSGDFAGTTSR